MGFQTFDEVQALNEYAILDAGNSMSGQTLIAVSGRVARVDTLIGCNSDTIDHDVGFYINTGAGNIHIGYVHIPAGAGDPTVPHVDVLAALLPATSDGLLLTEGTLLGAVCYVAVTGAFKVQLFAIGGLI